MLCRHPFQALCIQKRSLVHSDNLLPGIGQAMSSQKLRYSIEASQEELFESEREVQRVNAIRNTDLR